MFELLDDQIFRSIWNYHDCFETVKPHEYFPEDVKAAKIEAKKYFKGKKIVRFAFVLPKKNR